MWPWQLDDKLKDWKANKLWFCPTAKKPVIDEQGNQAATLNIYNAWGIFTNTETCSVTQKTYYAGPNGMAGSYTINGYVLTIPTDWNFEGGVPARDGWRKSSAPGANNIPLFVDALRFDLWPLHSQGPATNEFERWTGNNMGRCCINRHDGYVGCAFLDFSARKVGLKELWTLKWHKSFNTQGPWTLAGGVTADMWPDWIRPFRDY